MISSLLPVFNRADIAFERGEGSWLWSTEGRKYLDFASGVAVTSLGHGHPRLVAALQDQITKVIHTSNLYRVPGQERVAEILVQHTFADTVFFCNSGAEAMECCIKMARKFHYANGAPQRNRIICADNAFHGRTLGTLAATGQAKYLEGFAPMLEGFDHVAYADLAAMAAAITDQTAAILVEIVQGEGGLVAGPAEYFQGLRKLADDHGILLIFDEVQTGVGRTGALFAHQNVGVTPDIMGSAKGLGGGVPTGACFATERAAKGMTPGTHGSTFGGNPLAMAAVEAVLEVMLEPGFFDAVKAKAQMLRTGLERLVAEHGDLVSDVRGIGLMKGIKAVIPNGTLIGALRENGLLTVAAGDNVVRLLPPLTITEDEIGLALSILSDTLIQLSK